MGIEEKLEKLKNKVDANLKSALEGVSPRMARSMKYSVLSGGKRFRPLLLITTGEMFECPHKQTLPFACALEMIHNYSLIHDDLPAMDNDDFRRGKPSCHKAFGEDVAILAGDALLTFAFEIMSRALLENFSQNKDILERGVQVIEEMSRAAGAGGMIEGQYLDIQAAGKQISEKDYTRLTLKKTASLLIVAVRAGALLGGAEESELKTLTLYSRHAGLAFQIRDDILDYRQDYGDAPSAVALEGVESAKKRLNRYVFSAVKELEKLPQDTHALRYLALKLLEVS